MAYASYTDIQSRLQKTFSSNQQTYCSTLLTDMSNYVDGMLGSIWVVPFSSPYPNLVVEITKQLSAGWFLLGSMVDQPQVEAVENRALGYIEWAEEKIQELLKNTRLLSGTTAVLRADSETAIGPQMRVSTSPPSITFQDSSHWRKPIPSAAFLTRQVPKEYA